MVLKLLVLPSSLACQPPQGPLREILVQQPGQCLTEPSPAGSPTLLLAPVLQAAGDDGAAVAAAVARVVAAMSERDVEWATAATPLAEALARLMLACAGRPEHLLAELATDYFLQVGTWQGPGPGWFCAPPASAPAAAWPCGQPALCVPHDMPAHWLQVNTMPLADRHPFLQREVYVLLAPCLLAHSQYPPDFTTWEEQYEVDQEAFARWGDEVWHVGQAWDWGMWARHGPCIALPGPLVPGPTKLQLNSLYCCAARASQLACSNNFLWHQQHLPDLT